MLELQRNSGEHSGLHWDQPLGYDVIDVGQQGVLLDPMTGHVAVLMSQ